MTYIRKFQNSSMETNNQKKFKDYINKHDDKIDYRIDNTLYLKDFKYSYKNAVIFF